MLLVLLTRENRRICKDARACRRPGAQILTCHGRTREQRGQNFGTRGLCNDTRRERCGLGLCVRKWQYPQGRQHWALHRRDRCSRGHVRRESCTTPQFLPLLPLRRHRAGCTRGTARIPGHLFEPEHASAPERDQGPPVPVFQLLQPALAQEVDLREALVRLRGPDLKPYHDVVREMNR